MRLQSENDTRSPAAGGVSRFSCVMIELAAGDTHATEGHTMVDRFPHMNDTGFPGLPGETAFLNNNFDYSKYDKTQMRIGICSVPWDVGLIHVGNAKIGGLGNVVYFETPEERDEYLDSIEDKYVWETEYREYHDDMYIQVPLPYEKAVRYNYIWVEYTRLPVDYSEGGKERFFFFIRECSQLAASTCKVKVLRDTWQTFIHDVDITHVFLDRGHAPIALTDAETYLENPRENATYLLADDVNYGHGAMRHAMQKAIALNSGEMYAAVCMSGDLQGELDEQVPARTMIIPNGQPAFNCYAVEASELENFLFMLETYYPHMVQTIQGVFFVSMNLVNVHHTFTLRDMEISVLEAARTPIDIVDLAMSQFGYADEYKRLAKLYTYPYAYLEVSDENGDAHEIHIEETSGNLSLQLTTSLAYPWLTLDGRITGVRGGDSSIEFSNVNENTFDFGGSWYKYIYQWKIPTFAVTQSAASRYDYTTRYEREQAANNAYISKLNADRNADTAQDNAKASAETARANAVRNAIAARDNAKASNETSETTANASAEVARDNAKASAETARANAVRSAIASRDNTNASADTAETNAKNSAATNETNAKNNAATIYADAIDSADAAYSEAETSAAAQYDNSIDANSMQYTNATKSATATYNIETNSAAAEREKFTDERHIADEYMTYNFIKSYNIGGASLSGGYVGIKEYLDDQKLEQDRQVDAACQTWITALDNEYAAVTTALNGIGNGASLLSSGGAGGVVAGAINLATTTASIPISISNSQEVAEAYKTAGEEKTRHARNYLGWMYELTVLYEGDKYRTEQKWLTAIADLMKAKADENATYSKNLVNGNPATGDIGTAKREQNTHDGNALRTKTAADTNADTARKLVKGVEGDDTKPGTAKRDKDTADTNAVKAKSTADTNALNTKNTTKGNATREYNKDIANSTATKNTAYANADREYKKDLDNSEAIRNTADDNADRAYNTAILNAVASKTTAYENAERDYETAKDNNQAVYDNALEAIENGIKQAALGEPSIFGDNAYGETSTTRPQAVFCNIVTQLPDEIAQAGDYFLRYGYAVNRYWEFDGFNKMKHFTYWKCSDVNIQGNNVPDAYLDEIRFYLMGGVCVWKNPDDIGRISVYDNL